MKKDEQTTSQGRKFRKTTLNFTIDFLAFLLMLSMIGTGVIIRYVLPPGSGGRGGGYGLTLWGMDRHDWGGVHFWLAVFLLGLLVLHVALHWSWVCNFVRRHVSHDRSHSRISQRAAIAFGAGFFVLLNLLVVWFLWASDSNVFVNVGGGEHLEPTKHEVVKRKWIPIQEQLPSRSESLDPETEHDCGNEPHVQRFSGRDRNNQKRGAAPGRGLGRSNRVDKNTNDGRWRQGRRTGRRAVSSGTSSIQGSMTLKEVSNKTGVPVDIIKESLSLPDRVSSHERLGRLKRRYGFQIEDLRRIVAKHRQR